MLNPPFDVKDKCNCARDRAICLSSFCTYIMGIAKKRVAKAQSHRMVGGAHIIKIFLLKKADLKFIKPAFINYE
jgi:hypothetical protein